MAEKYYNIQGLPSDLIRGETPGARELKVTLSDGLGNPLSSYYNAVTNEHVLSIHDADVHNVAVNKFVHQHTAVQTTLTADTAGDGTVYQIPVTDATGFAIGDAIHLNTGSVETTHPIIKSSVPALPTAGAAIFTLDRRLDVAHSIGDEVIKVIINIASQAGTLASPQEYWAGPEPGEVWHITGINIAMGHTTAGDLESFGNLSPLPNGVTVRVRVNGQYGTLTNWKINGDIDGDTGNVRFPDRSLGLGTYGTSASGEFKIRTGAVMRLDGNNVDRFEVYVQDDLTTGAPDLKFFDIKVQGHREVG